MNEDGGQLAAVFLWFAVERVQSLLFIVIAIVLAGSACASKSGYR